MRGMTTNDNLHSGGERSCSMQACPFHVRVLLSDVLSTEQRVTIKSAPAALKSNTCLDDRGSPQYLMLSVAVG